jgi:prepilin-type N-terminal cleavage/methylation domain-containing protein
VKRHAFTLLELLIVITIIALLAALLFPTFRYVIVRGRELHCQNNLRQLALAILEYAAARDMCLPPPCKTGALGTAYLSGWVCDKDWYIDGGLLYQLEQTGSIDIFVCPVDVDEWKMEKKADGTDASGNPKQWYWTPLKPGRQTPSGDKVVSSYSMNANVWTAGNLPRRTDDFPNTAFLLVEECPKMSASDDAAIDAVAADKIATRHRDGGGFIACFDAHVIWMNQDDFTATKTDSAPEYLKSKRWLPLP